MTTAEAARKPFWKVGRLMDHASTEHAAMKNITPTIKTKIVHVVTTDFEVDFITFGYYFTFSAFTQGAPVNFPLSGGNICRI